jgi:hypothetical protein
MVTAHKEAIAQLMLGIMFGLRRDPTTGLVFGPLCLTSTSGRVKYVLCSQGHALHSGLLESNANVVPTDDTATPSKKLVPGVDSGVKCIGGRENVDRGTMIATPRERKWYSTPSENIQAKTCDRCDHVTHDS